MSSKMALFKAISHFLLVVSLCDIITVWRTHDFFAFPIETLPVSCTVSETYQLIVDNSNFSYSTCV